MLLLLIYIWTSTLYGQSTPGSNFFMTCLYSGNDTEYCMKEGRIRYPEDFKERSGSVVSPKAVSPGLSRQPDLKMMVLQNGPTAPKPTIHKTYIKLNNPRGHYIYDSDDNKDIVGILDPGMLIPFDGETSITVNGQKRRMATIKNSAGKTYYIDLAAEGEDLDWVDARAALGQRLYLDAPEGEVISLTKSPGKGSGDFDCETHKDVKAGKEIQVQGCGLGWPPAGPNSKLFVQDAKLASYKGDDGEERIGMFYKVGGEYLPKGKSNSDPSRQLEDMWPKGLWINANKLRSDELPQEVLEAEVKESLPELTVSPPVKPPPPEPLPDKPPEKCNCANDDLKSKAEVVKKTTESNFMSVDIGLLQRLDESLGVGQCVLSRSEPNLAQNTFNGYLKSFWHKKISSNGSTGLSFGSKKEPISQEQLYAIDALARTIFGEMRSCVKKGSRYPKAVARVIYNRALWAKQRAHRGKGAGVFVKDKGANVDGTPFDLKSANLNEILPRVMSSSSQFSVWNPTIKVKNKTKPNQQAKMLLCPERSKMNKDDKEAWTKILKVAAEAVLETEKFKTETKNIGATYYVSDIQPPWSSKDVDLSTQIPTVNGLLIDSPSCLKLYDASSGPVEWRYSFIKLFQNRINEWRIVREYQID